MGIVLNERDWAEEAIKEKALGRHPYQTLVRVAKYYLGNGCTTRAASEKLESFILSCDPRAQIVNWQDAIERAVKYAKKNGLIMIDQIHIQKREMDTINSLGKVQLQRIAFTLLCVAKFYHEVNPETDYWVSTPDVEIMKMANVSTQKKRRGLLYGQLRDLGLIRFQKQVDNLSVQVLFAQDGDTALEVTDFRSLGHQYMKYKGEPYYTCKNCGIVCRAENPEYLSRYKYCAECAAKIKMKQNVDSAMRIWNEKRDNLEI